MKNNVSAGLVAALAAALLSGCKQPAAQATTSAQPVPATSAAPSRTSDTVPTRLYQDAATGVSFRYPAAWTPAADPQGYLPAMIQDDKVQIRQSVVFSSEGNYYAQTNLENLAFSFGVLKGADSAACRSFVVGQPTGATPPRSVTVNGVSFNEVSGGDAAMSHRQSSTIDSTFQGGKCLVFERDEMTLAPGVKPGTRALTAQEDGALRRHLDDIFQSVRVADK